MIKRGIGWTGVLFLVFLGLKILGALTWGWWLIFAPIWIPLAFVFIVLFLMLLKVLLTQ